MTELLKLRQRLKKRLTRLWYGSFISLIICANSLTVNFVVALLVLPLFLYFLSATWKQTRKYRLFLTEYGQQIKTTPITSPYFSLANFLTQSNFSFRISLLLLILIIVTLFTTGRYA